MNNNTNRTYFSKEEMFKLNKEKLSQRGVTIEDIALITLKQQEKYTSNVNMDDCVKAIFDVLTNREVFHLIQLGIEIDKLVEEKKLSYPINNIIANDISLFGIDEIFGLTIANIYGTIGQTNFGDIDVNKPGIVNKLNLEGKSANCCHTFLDDIVGAIAAAASTKVCEIINDKNCL